MENKIICGEYTHFKGNPYIVYGEAVDMCGNEYVLYQHNYGTKEFWIRPTDMFYETIERDGKSMRRFTLTNQASREESFEKLLPCLDEAGFVPGGQMWKKMKAPDSIPASVKNLYLMRTLYFSKAETQMKWVYQKSLVNRVAKDFFAMAPVYRMLRGCIEQD